MNDVGVIVPSFDGYADVWPITADLFARFWPDRQWPMYWMTNGERVPSIAAPILRPRVGRDEWGPDIAEAVESIPEPLIVFWLEEIFPLSKVPNDLFLEAAEILRTTPDVGLVQLTRYYYSPETPTLGDFADYPAGKPGFSSAMPALFRKEVLLHLLRTLPKSNDFEQQSASVMLRDLPQVRCLASCSPMFRLCDNPVIGERWCECVIPHFKELGLRVDLSKRSMHDNKCLHMEGVPA